MASIAVSPAERPSPVASPSSYTVSEAAVDASTVAASSYTRDNTVERKWPIPVALTCVCLLLFFFLLSLPPSALSLSLSLSVPLSLEDCNFQLVFSGNIVCNEWLVSEPTILLCVCVCVH